MTTTRPIICLIIDRITLGGDARHAFELLQAMDRSPYRIHVVSLESPDDFAIDLQKLAVPVHSLDLPEATGFRGGWWSFAGTMTLFNLFLKLKPDIVHTMGPRAEVPGRIAARLAQVGRVVHTERRAGEDLSLRRFLARLTGSWLDCAVASTDAERTRFLSSRGLHPIRGRVIMPGVSPRIDCHVGVSESWPWSDGNPLLGTIGRPCKRSGTDVLIQAVELLAPFHQKLKVVALGQHLEGIACIREATRRGIGDRVYIPGNREEVPDILSQLDVFVLPQREDRVPLSLLEALASSRPCVVSATESLRELLTHEENALLVPPDHPALLANAIDRVLMDDELRLKLAANGRALFEKRLGARHMALAYSQLYEQLIRT